MPVMDLPPQAVYAPEPECRRLSRQAAQVAFQRLRERLPSTSFSRAMPSEICGLVRVEMMSGKVVYTDETGRYLLLTFALDTHRGSPADTSEALEQAIEARDTFPKEGIRGVRPPSTGDDVSPMPRMSKPVLQPQ